MLFYMHLHICIFLQAATAASFKKKKKKTLGCYLGWEDFFFFFFFFLLTGDASVTCHPAVGFLYLHSR